VAENALICDHFLDGMEELLFSVDGPPLEVLFHGEILQFDASGWRYNFCDDERV